MSPALMVTLLVVCFLAGMLFAWALAQLRRRALSARARAVLALYGARG